MSDVATRHDVSREIQEVLRERTQIVVYLQNVTGRELRQDDLRSILARSSRPPDVTVLAETNTCPWDLAAD